MVRFRTETVPLGTEKVRFRTETVRKHCMPRTRPGACGSGAPGRVRL